MDLATAGRAAESIMAKKPLRLTAYCTEKVCPRIEPATVDRKWMTETSQRFAHRCLPLRMANQAGWFILNERKVSVLWTGGDGLQDVRIRYFKTDINEHIAEDSRLAVSHFGHGIVTWRIPYLFRTPPGYNLYVSGPTNWCKDGVSAMSAIVETDWAVATFTMNWLITRPGVLITFDEGEPICMICPMIRGGLEQFEPELRNLSEDAALQGRYKLWASRRKQFLKLKSSNPQLTWEKHYYVGRTPDDPAFPDHQFRIAIQSFADRRNSHEQITEPSGL